MATSSPSGPQRLAAIVAERHTPISDTNPPEGAKPAVLLANAGVPPHSGRGMAARASRGAGSRRVSPSRRIVVVVVPPVDELDLVGPLQVFNSVNRMAGRAVYSVEVVTNADGLKVEGEGGLMAIVARGRFHRCRA